MRHQKLGIPTPTSMLNFAILERPEKTEIVTVSSSSSKNLGAPTHVLTFKAPQLIM